MKKLAASESDEDSENSLEKLTPSERISSNPRYVSMVVLQFCVRVVVMEISTDQCTGPKKSVSRRRAACSLS